MADNKKTEIFNKVSKIVADHFDVDRAKITDDLNLKTDLDADSIDFVEFVLELEDTFGEEINDEDAEKLSTIGEVVDYIAEHTAN
ncbi:acyl carrier protein [Limosilactobacillus reuteri]|uniref:acyl carrier protein n=1 Tax=Limosilactobacillus reuteri TaxID=1598 RepID=UPI003D001228